MKPAVLLVSLFMRGLAAAQLLQSKPFKLIVRSEDKELNGRAFGTCSEKIDGMSLSSMCLINSTGTFDSSAIFHLVTEQDAQSGPGGVAGYLIYYIHKNPQSMSFFNFPSSNVALTLFYSGIGSGQPVGFDEHQQMNYVAAFDDTTSPPSASTRVLKNWYFCTTRYMTEQPLQTLNWVIGIAKPQNPSCVKVDVERQFVEGTSE
ncbi:hypothetical protein EsDP_00004038 [Epichloe bromicola]|uniref:Uncharacterized protein n=1 Tax=Epichloe bromicola TaxID=79588 RepID=A0ABQ0CQK4_9HYPO